MSTSKRTHPVNVSYLVVGLVCLGIAGSWALRASGVVDAADGRWLAPLILVGAGVIGLVAFAAKSLSRHHEDDSSQPPDHPEYVGETTYDPYTSDPYTTYDEPTTTETSPRQCTDQTTEPTTDQTTELDRTEGDRR